jgi:HK97 family phage major capsid protein
LAVESFLLTALSDRLADFQGRLTAEHIEAARRHKIPTPGVGGTLEIELPPRAEIRNALSAGDGSRGGYLAPAGFVERLEIARGAWPIAGLAIVERRDGNPVSIATVDVSSAEGIEVSENRDQSASYSDPTFQRSNISMRTFRARMNLPAELDQDAPDFIGQMPDVLGSQLGAIQNRRWTSTLTEMATAATSAGAGVIAGDDLENILGTTLTPEHLPGTTIMLSPEAFLAARKLKDGGGLYLADGKTWRGFPVVVNSHLASVSTGNVVALIGDFSKFLIVENSAVAISVDRETLAGNDQVLWFARHRANGVLVGTGTRVAMAKLTIS